MGDELRYFSSRAHEVVLDPASPVLSAEVRGRLFERVYEAVYKQLEARQDDYPEMEEGQSVINRVLTLHTQPVQYIIENF